MYKSIIEKKLHWLEDIFLVSLLMIMILTAVIQIVLRNFMGSGIIWGDAMVRILVLWIGLLGAMSATRNNNHININILQRYLPERFKFLAASIVMFFTSFLCGLTTYYAQRFIQMEYEYQSPGFAQVPAWLCEIIIPIAFAIIAIRCFITGLKMFFLFLRKTSEPTSEDPEYPG
jgi:TRAP-type C4-dicarboxylate transport system permease small subunit